MTEVNHFLEVIKTAANAPFLAFLYRIKRNMLLRIWALQSILQNQNPFFKMFLLPSEALLIKTLYTAIKVLLWLKIKKFIAASKFDSPLLN